MAILGKKKPAARKATKATKAAAPASQPSQNAALLGAVGGVLLHPLVTEKAATLASHRQYAFVVAPGASKVAVAQAVLVRYGVRPTSVNVMNVMGKSVRSRSGQSGRRRDWRKAIVTVPAGATLTLMENV